MYSRRFGKVVVVTNHAHARMLERNVDDHVFLPTDHLLPAELEEDVLRVDAVPRRSPLRVQQEGAVHAGVAEQQTVSIDDALLGTDRPDGFLKAVVTM